MYNNKFETRNKTHEKHNKNNINNGATLTEDRFGKKNSAYSFDGINDYIDFGTFIAASKIKYCSYS